MTKTVTFETILDPDKETPKAYKVWAGDYYPKSLVTVSPTGQTTPRTTYDRWNRAIGTTLCPIMNITMPKWLAER
jgi:hypothetical protein